MQRNILSYLQNSALKFPLKTAIKDEKESINFSELNFQAKAIATHLQSLNIVRNRPIGVFLPKSIKAIKSFLGILYNGCFYVPLDVKNPTPRLEAIIKNLKLEFIVTDAKHAEILKNLNVNLIIFDEIDISKKDKFDTTNYENTIDTDPIYILNTSGSTGVPKGVTLPHRSIIDYIDWIVKEYKLDENLIIANQSPLVFDISTSDIYVTMAVGATLILVGEQLFTFPIKLVEFLESQNVNFIFWVPSILSNIAKLDLLKDRKLYIKTIICGGELMPTKHLMYWQKHLPDAVCVNTGGATEVGVVCTYYNVDREFSDTEILPIGKPCENTEVLILDENDKLITQKNVVGEFCIKGSSLALGYYNDPAKTASAFTQNPLNLEYPEQIYRTGDLAYYNDRGELMYKGRKDFQIKHMGYRIELGEIETAALSLSGIDSACALYDDAIILIYTSQFAISQKEILLYLGKILPKYMLPTRFIALEEMPLNINGKIDRNKLKNLIKE